MAFLYHADPSRAHRWREVFAAEAPDIPFFSAGDRHDPAAIRYLVIWEAEGNLAERYPDLEVVFSAGAGTDQFTPAHLPPEVPLVRMVEPGLAAGMAEYVCAGVLLLHRDLIGYIADQRNGRWNPRPIVPAEQRCVGVMGLGALGMAVLAPLKALGFRLAGWNRSSRSIEGVETYAGAQERDAFLARCDILVCLLPLTPETRGCLNADLFARLPEGAGIVNVGRGGHLVEADLLAALDRGRIGGAVLDVFAQEPLPQEHRFWHHPRVFLTPHMASMTQPEGGARAVIANIRRHRAGEPLLNRVDRSRGY
ncbi:MAG: 2-hydroxyacid dehydrogenase [Pseudochelatococcus sp.]|jgi:glyoxylate/hydroxypyruvate reductase A|uniref:2-hydroxyacid dehydrogenase n=1 Tax=Pseudochelatococcus sp. TaxID=2020869 RepID=UPI003D8B93B8